MKKSVIADTLSALHPILRLTRKGKPYVSHLSEEEYGCGMRALNKIERLIEKWPEEPLDEQEENLIWIFACVCYESSDTCDWKDMRNPDSPDLGIIRSEEERLGARKEAKKMIVSDIEECREHLALRLCATQANRVALVLGRTDLRVYFESGYHAILNAFSVWELDMEAPYGLRDLCIRLFDG